MSNKTITLGGHNSNIHLNASTIQDQYINTGSITFSSINDSKISRELLKDSSQGISSSLFEIIEEELE